MELQGPDLLSQLEQVKTGKTHETVIFRHWMTGTQDAESWENEAPPAATCRLRRAAGAGSWPGTWRPELRERRAGSREERRGRKSSELCRGHLQIFTWMLAERVCEAPQGWEKDHLKGTRGVTPEAHPTGSSCYPFHILWNSVKFCLEFLHLCSQRVFDL